MTNRHLCRLRNTLEDLYRQYNRRELVHPDPLEFVYEYHDPADREIVALIAASLAYGRVAQILRSVRQVLDLMGRQPRRFLERARTRQLQDALAPFKHRWTTGQEVADLLGGMQRVIRQHGSLQGAFAASLEPEHESVHPALEGFVEQLRADSALKRNSLLPCVQAGGACKRMHLFLRWMVRQDDVDPGCWQEVPQSELIVPLDTHMHRLGLVLGMTHRQQADLRTAMEITSGFKAICPEDPARYDFALTRFGIRPELDERIFLQQCRLLCKPAR